MNISRSFEGETNQDLTPGPSDKARLRNSAKHRPGQPGGAGFDLAQGPGRLPSRPPGRLCSRPGCPRSTTQSTWVAQVDYPVDLGVLGGKIPALANPTRFLKFKFVF